MNFYLGPRRSTATASSSSTNTTAATPVKDDFPEALTYRFNDNSAWVPAARTHEEAIDLAKHAYPELRSVRRDRITFHTTGKSSIACITPAAWQLVVRRLPPYHVVDVRIRDPIEGHEGETDDAELPEYYPYMAASYTIAREKEQQQGQEQPPSAKAAENGGSRLRRMMSFVRGTD